MSFKDGHTAMWRHLMPFRRPTKTNGWFEWITIKSQRKPCSLHALMMMMMMMMMMMIFVYIYSPAHWHNGESVHQSFEKQGSIPGRITSKTQKNGTCLTLNILRYGSRVVEHPGKGVALSSTPWSSSYWKTEPSSRPRLRLPTLLIYIYIYYLKDIIFLD